MRCLRESSMLPSGLNANSQMRTRKTRKLTALTITQKRLIVNPPAVASAVSWAAACAVPDATA